jgi:hypothetical protein
VTTGTKSYTAKATVQVSSSSIIGKTVFTIKITVPGQTTLGEYAYTVYQNDSTSCSCDTSCQVGFSTSSSNAFVGQYFDLYELTVSGGYNSMFNELNVAIYNNDGSFYILDANNGQGNNVYWISLSSNVNTNTDSSGNTCLNINGPETITEITSLVTNSGGLNRNRLWKYDKNNCMISTSDSTYNIGINECGATSCNYQYQFSSNQSSYNSNSVNCGSEFSANS